MESFVAQPANALLITGKPGSGKKILASRLSAALLGVKTDRVADNPQFIRVSKPEDKSEIPIELVREVSKKLSLRVASNINKPINRVVLFEDAQNLSHEAQNALLKLLEEPPERSLLILTATEDDSLLPTVVSRAQKITVVPPSLDQAIEYYKNRPRQEVESAYKLSRGISELLNSLLANQTEHSLKVAVGQAKTFIKNDSYGRLIQVQAISKSRADYEVFLDALSKVLAALHEESLKSDKHQLSAGIIQSRKAVLNAMDQLNHSSNVRLTSLALVLNFSI